MSDYGANPNPDLDLARLAAFTYRLANLRDLKYDEYSHPDGNVVGHFVQKRTKSRLVVKFE